MRFVSDNASRVCSEAGDWAERTDYSHCRQLEPASPAPDTAALPAHLEISIVIYLIGAAVDVGGEYFLFLQNWKNKPCKHSCQSI